jgi:PASTA domain
MATRRELPADIAAAFDKGAKVVVNVSTGTGPSTTTVATTTTTATTTTAPRRLAPPDPFAYRAWSRLRRTPALRRLNVLGLRPTVVYVRSSQPANMDGLVVEQQPRAGSRIPAGSQVTIFVGRFSG